MTPDYVQHEGLKQWVADMVELCKEYREKMVEAAAEGNEDLLHKYLEEGTLSDEERQRFIVSLALKTADHYHDNRTDVAETRADFRKPFIETLNQRMADYAEFRFSDGEPGYAFKRYLGDRVTATMGERDRKWISSQVMDIEVPEMLKTLNKQAPKIMQQHKARGVKFDVVIKDDGVILKAKPLKS